MGVRKRRLSERQRKLAEYLVENPDCTLKDAGLAAGYENKNPAASAYNALTRKSVQERIAELMDKDPELRDPALLERLKHGLDSKKKTYGIEKGQILDERTDEDMPTRQQYLKLAFQLKGALVNKQEISGGDKPVQMVDLSFLKADQLLDLIEKTKDE